METSSLQQDNSAQEEVITNNDQMDKVSVKPLDLNMKSDVENSETNKSKKPVFLMAVFLVVILGVGSGYVLASSAKGGGGLTSLTNGGELKREVSSQDEIKAGLKVGVADESTFRDDAEGVIEKGGIEGEGSHKLIRPGGDSQTVALTSSIIDLDQFVGHKVKIWGETMAAQKSGWFMDIGKLEVLE